MGPTPFYEADALVELQSWRLLELGVVHFSVVALVVGSRIASIVAFGTFGHLVVSEFSEAANASDEEEQEALMNRDNFEASAQLRSASMEPFAGIG